jgi:hypothetical protein
MTKLMPCYNFTYVDSLLMYVIKNVDPRFTVHINFVEETSTYNVWITEAGCERVLWTMSPRCYQRNTNVDENFKLTLPVFFCSPLEK